MTPPIAASSGRVEIATQDRRKASSAVLGSLAAQPWSSANDTEPSRSDSGTVGGMGAGIGAGDGIGAGTTGGGGGRVAQAATMVAANAPARTREIRGTIDSTEAPCFRNALAQPLAVATSAQFGSREPVSRAKVQMSVTLCGVFASPSTSAPDGS